MFSCVYLCRDLVVYKFVSMVFVLYDFGRVILYTCGKPSVAKKIHPHSQKSQLLSTGGISNNNGSLPNGATIGEQGRSVEALKKINRSGVSVRGGELRRGIALDSTW